MSRHFKKDTFEAFANKNIGDKAKAAPAKGAASASGSTAAFGQTEWKAGGEKKLNLKWGDGGRVLRAVWQWGKDAEKRKDFNPAEQRYLRHAKGRALALLGFGCVWAYYNPEHSIISRKWHAYRAAQIEQTPSNRIAQMLAEEGAEVRVMREERLTKEEEAAAAAKAKK